MENNGREKGRGEEDRSSRETRKDRRTGATPT
jgi:hypothetical protein